MSRRLQFADPPAPAREANLLPMINVVFLLLVFFLIAARLAPPEPFAVTPPEAAAQDPAAGDFALYLGPAGELGFEGALSAAAEGDAPVLAALEAARAGYCAAQDCAARPPHLLLRADAGAPVARLAALLPQLGAAGFAQVDLVTREGAGAGVGAGVGAGAAP